MHTKTGQNYQKESSRKKLKNNNTEQGLLLYLISFKSVQESATDGGRFYASMMSQRCKRKNFHFNISHTFGAQMIEVLNLIRLGVIAKSPIQSTLA